MMNEFFITICGIFALAGFVKGTIGFGLPTIAIGLGALFLDIPTAMMLILMPAMLTNIFQVFGSGSITYVLTKTWPFMLASMVLVPLGLIIVGTYPSLPFDRLLGSLIVLYSFVTLRGFRLNIPDSKRNVVGIFSGLVNSILTGLTGSFSVPGVMYLRTFDFSKDDFLCSIGLLFSLSTIAMGYSLVITEKATLDLSFISALMCIPVGIGVFVGTRIRLAFTEAQFTRIFLWFFMILGLYLVIVGGL